MKETKNTKIFDKLVEKGLLVDFAPKDGLYTFLGYIPNNNLKPMFRRSTFKYSTLKQLISTSYKKQCEILLTNLERVIKNEI